MCWNNIWNNYCTISLRIPFDFVSKWLLYNNILLKCLKNKIYNDSFRKSLHHGGFAAEWPNPNLPFHFLSKWLLYNKPFEISWKYNWHLFFYSILAPWRRSRLMSKDPNLPFHFLSKWLLYNKPLIVSWKYNWDLFCTKSLKEGGFAAQWEKIFSLSLKMILYNKPFEIS